MFFKASGECRLHKLADSAADRLAAVVP